MPGKHSVIVGGSSSGRLLFCPASWQEMLRIPETQLGQTSEYAEEGTAMHAVMELLMSPEGENFDPRDLIGEHFHDRKLTLEHVETMIDPAISLMNDLMEAYDPKETDPFEVMGTEAEVTFPGIPGAFGSLDLRIANSKYVIMIDYKFGAGKGVAAVYSDPQQGDFVNPQLQFYAKAALNTFPAEDFEGKELVVAIIQPREPTGQTLTHTIVTREELDAYAEALTEAVVEALGRKPHRERGPWCDFAACRATCPLWTGPLLDAAALGIKKPVAPAAGKVTEFGQYLADAKRLLDTVAPLSKEIDAQVKAYLEAGAVVPGFALDDIRSNRKWIEDHKRVAAELRGLGFKEDEIYQEPKLQTFTVADAAAKKLKVEIPADLRPVPPSSGTKVVAVKDGEAPPITRSAALTAFGKQLRAMVEGPK